MVTEISKVFGHNYQKEMQPETARFKQVRRGLRVPWQGAVTYTSKRHLVRTPSKLADTYRYFMSVCFYRRVFYEHTTRCHKTFTSAHGVQDSRPELFTEGWILEGFFNGVAKSVYKSINDIMLMNRLLIIWKRKLNDYFWTQTKSVFLTI